VAARKSAGSGLTKPVIFLSHSSKDASVLARLKNALLDKTSGTTTIFLSSDGQSVPLGRNWVHSIEEALTSSALMLVCVSPRALQSQWIFFEAGFAYSRQVQVVPVGLPGVDLSDVPAPLSLLQGFNISSHQGLNNILALLNKVFGVSYPETFTDADYHAIFGKAGRSEPSVLGPYADAVDRVIFHTALEQRLNVKTLPALLPDYTGPWQVDGSTLRTYGIAFVADLDKPALRASIKPAVAHLGFELVDDLLKRLPWDSQHGFQMGLLLAANVNHQEDLEAVSAAFAGTKVRLLPDRGFELGEFYFRIEWQDPKDFANAEFTPIYPKRGYVVVQLAYTGSSLRNMNLSELLETLFETGVLYFRNA
jgi:hypothetical protein